MSEIVWSPDRKMQKQRKKYFCTASRCKKHKNTFRKSLRKGTKKVPRIYNVPENRENKDSRVSLDVILILRHKLDSPSLLAKSCFCFLEIVMLHLVRLQVLSVRVVLFLWLLLSQRIHVNSLTTQSPERGQF